jgi:preprotein translocase subunit SecD
MPSKALTKRAGGGRHHLQCRRSPFRPGDQENVGKPLAIILDDKVVGTQHHERSGRPRRSAAFFVKRQRAGHQPCLRQALPVKLNVVEERTAQRRAGQGLDRAGTIASIFATLAVIGLMIVTYGRSAFMPRSRC